MVGEQVQRGVGDLLQAREPPERDRAPDPLLELLARPQARGGPLGVERARRDPVDPDPVAGPLDGKGAGQREDPRLGAGAVDRAGAPRPSVGREDIEDRAPLARARSSRAPRRGSRRTFRSGRCPRCCGTLPREASPPGRTKFPAALLTRPSTRPNRSVAARTRARTWRWSRTSVGTAIASPPASSMAARAASSRPGSRPARTSRAPRRAAPREILRPSPDPPPVTIRTRPESEPSGSIGWDDFGPVDHAIPLRSSLMTSRRDSNPATVTAVARRSSSRRCACGASRLMTRATGCHKIRSREVIMRQAIETERLAAAVAGAGIAAAVALAVAVSTLGAGPAAAAGAKPRMTAFFQADFTDGAYQQAAYAKVGKAWSCARAVPEAGAQGRCPVLHRAGREAPRGRGDDEVGVRVLGRGGARRRPEGGAVRAAARGLQGAAGRGPLALRHPALTGRAPGRTAGAEM